MNFQGSKYESGAVLRYSLSEAIFFCLLLRHYKYVSTYYSNVQRRQIYEVCIGIYLYLFGLSPWSGLPDQLTQCGVYNQTVMSFEVGCQQGSDGGLQQTFVMVVWQDQDKQVSAGLAPVPRVMLG